jgi:hypothetical protein
MRMIRIFLSSPGDCQGERAAVHAVKARLNADPLVTDFARLEVVAWDWAAGVPLDALASPQVSINRHLSTPEACDIFVGIFRYRFGTPMPTTEFRKDDGSAFQSGSEYEFDRAWRARRGGAAVPEVLMYRLDAQVAQSCLADAQLDLVNAFFDRAPFKAGDQWTGSINAFSDIAGFERLLDGHLRLLLSARRPGAPRPLHSWLEQFASRVEHDAGPRYTRAIHVDSEVGQVFDWLLARPEAIHAFDELLSHVWKKLDDPGLAEFKAALQRVALELREDPIWRSPPDFNVIAHVLEQLAAKAWELADAAEREDSAGSNSQGRHIGLQQLAGQAQEALRLLQQYAGLPHRRVLLLTGPAGQGKTHTLVHELKRIVGKGGVAIGALGQKLPASVDLRRALLQTWEFAGSFGEFLDTLENVAAQKNERALLIVDALNETPNRERWKNELNGILHEALQRPHLVVAFSVRSDYRLHVLPEETPGKPLLWVEHEHRGFAGIEPDALLGYCAHYGVTAPVAPPIGELSNPLYVQLLVRSLQSRSNLTHWLPSWLEVWEAWIARLEGDARGRLTLDPSRSHPIRRCLNKLATAMIASGKFQLLREEANQIALATAGLDGVVCFLCSAGALIDRIENDDDIIEFGFERLSDTFFADRLLAGLFKGKAGPIERRQALEAALGADGVLAALAVPGRFDAPLSSRRTGLLEALCLAVPPLIGAELPDLIPVEVPDSHGWAMPDWELREAFTDSLRWRCRPAEFAGDRRSLWRLYRRRGSHHGNPADLDELLRLALIPGHPFGMEHLLHPRLARQRSVGARDAIWTIELVPLWADGASNLSVLVRWAGESNLSGLRVDMAIPAARVIAWVCATSQQGLREQATRSLTRILAACPAALLQILRDFLSVNDDYVLESVLTASLGVMIDGREPPVCKTAARLVYAAMFEDGKPRCHLTIRHYARRIVETAAERGWLTGVDLADVRPPYTSVLPLADVPSKRELQALDRSGGFGRIVGSALGHDFYWYVMGATSGGKPFSSAPLPGSSEPVRAFGDGEDEGGRTAPSAVFDSV